MKKKNDKNKIKVRTPKPKIKTFTRIHRDKKNDYKRKKKFSEGDYDE
jgi:hypothetical protein